MKRKTKNIIALFLLLLTVGAVRAQVDDKGVTSTGKEVDCSTINSSVDQTVDQYGAIVTRPTLTRNGKLITRDCYCPFDLGDGNASITDFVYCTSVKMFAKLSYRDPDARVLPSNPRVYVFTDAAYTNCTDTIEATVLAHPDGTDTLTVDITDLNCYTRYYFRLVATNTTECVFDWTDSTRDATLEEPTYCTVNSAIALLGGTDRSHEHLVPGSTTQIDSVYDHEGNAYAVVQIGEQCWLKENMRAKTSPSTGHTLMLTDTSSMYYSSVSKCASNSKYYMSDKVYGLLYNWCAALDTFKPGCTELANRTVINDTWNCTFPSSCRRGICPQGWHIPSDQDWMDLTTMAGVSHVKWNENPSGDEHCCLGKLTGGCAWPTIDNGSHPGSYLYPERNITGFSILPSGYSTESGRENEGVDAGFICSSMFISNGRCCSYDRTCYNGNEALTKNDNPITFGFSVRCVRNAQAKNYCNVDFVLNNEKSNIDGRIDSVQDHQGNWYKVVEIGGQCWLAENMRATTSPRQGQVMGSLVMNLHNGVGTSQTMNSPRWYDFNTTAQKVTDLRQRGILYNWSAAFDTITSSSINYSKSAQRGICPSGWHLPTDAEWDLLSSNVLNESKGAGKLAGDYWNASSNATAPGNSTYSEHNITGFSAVPVGIYTNNNFGSSGTQTCFWSATSYDANDAWYRNLTYEKENLIRYNGMSKNNGFSVRCLRNETSTTANISFHANGGSGSMPDMDVMTMKDTFLVARGEQIFHSGNFVFAGWNTMMDGSGDTYDDGARITPGESMVLYAQWDTYCNTLFVREQSGSDQSHEHAYDGATNQIDSVYDHEGNAYGVVQIGDQCWLKENMRATTQSGLSTSILKLPFNNTYSNSVPYAYYYSNSLSNYNKYGCLYNYTAALGICPNGWHLPMDDEWQALMTSASIGIGSGSGAGKLASGCDWTSGGSGNSSHPGNLNYSDRNSTGFSALPDGGINSVGFANIGNHATFWSATSGTTSNSNRWSINYNDQYVTRTTGSSDKLAFSVRCVRDKFIPEMSVCADTILGTVTLKEVKNVAKVEFVQDGTVKKTINNPATLVYINDLAIGAYDVKATSPSGETLEDNVVVKHTYSHCTIKGNLNQTDDTHHTNFEWGNNTTHRIDSVSDHEGNVYEVVQIGGQCWLKQNMRAMTSRSGAPLIQHPAASPSFKDKIAYYVNDDSANVSSCGILYNWQAAIDSTFTSDNNTVTLTEPRQGICPDGWHVPSAEEFKALFNYLVVGVTSGTGVTKVVTDCQWLSSTGETPGGASEAMNSSAFSMVPTGYYNNSEKKFYPIGDQASYWTVNNNGKNTTAFKVQYNEGFAMSWGTDRASGRSVRCVRDYECDFIPETSCNVLQKLSNEHQSATGVIDSVYDHQGNDYAVVQIGNQCWLKENMRCTTSPRQGTGTGQVNLKNSSSASSSTTAYNNTPYYFDYNTLSGTNAQVVTDLRERGYLYNWVAAMDTSYGTQPGAKDFNNRRGICPSGWHLPTDGEWWQLENATLTGLSQTDSSRTAAYKGNGVSKLTGGCNWKISTKFNSPGSYSDSLWSSIGLSILPTGIVDGSFKLSGTNASFWSATSYNQNNAFRRYVDYQEDGIYRSNAGKYGGFSVRCVRNVSAPATISFHANGGSGSMEAMNVTTMRDTVLDARGTNITHEGNWAFTGWNTKRDGTGTAYANQAHITPTESITLYAQWHTWCDGNALSNNELGSENGRVDSVKDHQDNWYKVVQIGDQCWLKENMRCTTAPENVVTFTHGGYTSNYATPHYYTPAGTQTFTIGGAVVDSARYVERYGIMYNFSAAMTINSLALSFSYPVRGICPQGWHLPQFSESESLMSTMGITGSIGTNGVGAGKLVYGCEWHEDNTAETSPGNFGYIDRNSSGFSALPAGAVNDGSYDNVGDGAYFWTSTPTNVTTEAKHFRCFYKSPGMHMGLTTRGYAFSVRCVRNN